MTAAELIRSARSRAGLAQHELAEILDTPRSQISRWEAGEVEPAFATVRRVLRACGFDLSTALVPFDPDAPLVSRLVELSRLTPKERLDAALLRGGSERMGYQLDPYGILAALDEQGVNCILIGSLARVLQGADEVPGGVDLVFPRGARHATDEAIRAFALPGAGLHRPSMAMPGSTTCRAARRSRHWRRRRARAATATFAGGPSGCTSAAAFDPAVAAPGDLVRMMEALGRPEQASELGAMRRAVELDRGLDPKR